MTEVEQISDNEYIPETVKCLSCGWFGMSDDCHYNQCPNCGQRIIKEK